MEIKENDVKAMVLEAFAPAESGPLVLRDRPRPVPGPGEALVRVRYCGVCHTDLHTIEGEIVPPKMPIVPGHQVVGVVEGVGDGARRLAVGQRVGLAWLARTCGICSYCRRGEENLCESALFHGFHLDGGYAEHVLVHEDFAYPIPDGFTDEQAAPLLCAGIIGYRALRRAGIGPVRDAGSLGDPGSVGHSPPGRRVGLYGFGASAHVAIQVAVHWGSPVYVFSRSASHRELAMKLGAVWAGTADEVPPQPLDSSIIFAPAGPLVLNALEHLDKEGTVALAGIYMTPIPELDYEKHLYHEKTLTSVTASTRQDGRELLELAAAIPIRTETETFPLEEANEVLARLKAGGIDGAAVLRVAAE
jgi:propanol-preferring alcohol dehydrogenase